MSKVSDGKPSIPHDPEALQEFADDVKNCEQTLKSMDYLAEVTACTAVQQYTACISENSWPTANLPAEQVDKASS